MTQRNVSTINPPPVVKEKGKKKAQQEEEKTEEKIKCGVFPLRTAALLNVL